MKKDDMKNAYGKAPQSFHYAVMRSLNSLEEKQKVRSKSRVMRTAVACALIVAIGTAGIITAKAVYPMVAEREGNYGMNIDIDPTIDGTDNGSQVNAENMNFQIGDDSKNVPEYVKLDIGYLPDGVIVDSPPIKYSYNGECKEKCFTFVFERVSGKQTFSESIIEDYEQFTVNGNPAILAHVAGDMRQGENPFSKRFYIYFESKGLFVMCYVTDDVSDEEIKKVMENLSVVEGTQDDNTGGSFSEATTAEERSRMKAEDEAARAYDEWLAANTKISFSTVNLGQTIGYDWENIDEDLKDSEKTDIFDPDEYRVEGLGFSIDKIEVLDNVADLDVNCFETNISENIYSYVDENGSFLPYTREVMEYGDGIDSANKIVSSETMNRKLVYVTVTVNNTSESPRCFYLRQIGIERLEQNNGGLGYFCSDDVLPELANRGEISFIDNNNVPIDGQQHGYYFLDMPANSSKTVHLGFLADEDMLDQLYVTVSGDDSCLIYDAKEQKFVDNDSETNFGYACVKVQ